jgi:ADP-heptose:LPS heptosyltransferase
VQHLILTNHQSPGDIVMLTAAVRDLHRTYAGQFVTDVRTSCPQLWENNPHITPLDEFSQEMRTVECHYPLIQRSNSIPVHFLEGFVDYLNSILGIHIELSEFRGAIYLTEEEKRARSQVAEITGGDPSFWIISAGGKSDFTIKWWESQRYQQVVNYFRGQILFVQIGETSHHHPLLDGVVDLRGQTDLRQLIRLVYHSEGVLSPVSLPMHLAAAVDTRPGRSKHRPCVVVAGGREPPHWEAYPHHQFIHTVGSLPCCERGGCWKSRTFRLGDGSRNDLPESLCVDIRSSLPACMDMITAEDVIRRIEYYGLGGMRAFRANGQS